jgi:hypothetical protein
MRAPAAAAWVLAATLASATAAAQPICPLGSAPAPASANRAVVPVTSTRYVRYLVIMVHRGAVEIIAVHAFDASGTRADISVGRHIAAEGETGWLELPGPQRPLTRVEVTYRVRGASRATALLDVVSIC